MSVPAQGQGRRAPIDARLAQYRRVLEALLESLDATVSVSRQAQGESVPEPLERTAAQLIDRLGAATRLASGRFNGTPAFVATTTAIALAIQQLDAAFVTFRRRVGRSASERGDAAIALDAEIARVKLESPRWEMP